jgi:hypothetical protein
MNDDRGVEQALRVGAPPVRDECDACERVPREVVEYGVEYLVRKVGASEAALWYPRPPVLSRQQCKRRRRRHRSHHHRRALSSDEITMVYFELWYVRVGAKIIDHISWSGGGGEGVSFCESKRGDSEEGGVGGEAGFGPSFPRLFLK